MAQLGTSDIYRRFQAHFRPRRLRLLYSNFDITSETRLLDLGGGLYFWELARAHGFRVPRITIVNLRPAPEKLPPDINWIIADATNTGLATGSFDIVFSNSLIEHLVGPHSQLLFANEVKRLCTRYFIQTPNKWFFVEPHFVTPFVHWLPRSVRYALGPRSTLWGWTKGATRSQYEEQLKQIHLLGRSEVHELFPEADLLTEFWMGMAKSIIAVRGAKRCRCETD